MGQCLALCTTVDSFQTALFLGQSGSGKTHTLFSLLLNSAGGRSSKQDDTAKLLLQPTSTKGFNTEVVSLGSVANPASIEVWDVNGTNRSFWPSFYRNTHFDFIVYHIDVSAKAGSKKYMDDRLTEDRMELQALLAEPTLLNTYFLVYFNFKGTYGRERDAQEEYVRMTRDKLELSQSIHRLIFVHRFVDLDNLLVDLCRKLDR